MTSPKSNENVSTTESEIEIRDLERFLQRCYNSEDLKVIDYKAKNLLPPGENYASVIVRLDVKIRKKGLEEDLHFVAKKSEIGNNIMSWPVVFKKELFVYDELLPAYRDIERKAGVKESDLIDILPKFIGYRNSLKYNDEVDNNSIFIMENLKVKNYYTLDRYIGLDLYHAKKSMIPLAKYHALGIAMKQKRPEFAKRAIEHAQLTGIGAELIEEFCKSARRTFIENPRLSKYLDKLESSIDLSFKVELKEPWATIDHGDFWTNNIMFHKDEMGSIDDVKIIDFQTYEHRTPLFDLASFVGCCLDEVTMTNHVDELVELYHDTFIATLERVGCDVQSFGKKSFEAELKKQQFAAFVWCVIAIRFIAYDIKEEDKDNKELHKNVFHGETSKLCQDKILKLVEFYESRNWFL